MEINTHITINDEREREYEPEHEFSPDLPGLPGFDPTWFAESFPYACASMAGNYACEETVESDGTDFEELSPHELGREGERLAASYLAARGYEVIELNWRCREGEVDIIAKDEDGTTVLVEVKSRQARGAEAYVMPELAVDENKQHKLSRLALWYLVEHPHLHSVRFDVIAVSITGHTSARIRHLVGAFTWDE